MSKTLLDSVSQKFTAKSISAGVLSIDFTADDSNYYTVNLNEDITSIAISALPVAEAVTLTIETTQQGSFAIGGWPANTQWITGDTPSASDGAGTVDLFMLTTRDSGATWIGSAVQYFDGATQSNIDTAINDHKEQSDPHPQYLTLSEAPVQSVHGRSGAVISEQDDYNITQIDNQAQKQWIATGLYSGGEMTANSTTAIDIALGDGVINDGSDKVAPTITEITWLAKTAVEITNILTQNLTYIYLDSVGNVIQRASKTTAGLRDEIYLGFVNHPGDVILDVANTPILAGDASYLAMDMGVVLSGTITKGGNVSQNAITALSFDLDESTVFRMGINFHTDPTNPNFTIVAAQTPITFEYLLQDGSSNTGDITVVDPATYDNAGTPTAVPNPTATSTIQRLYYTGGSFFATYGQETYADFDTARNSITASNSTYVLPTFLNDATFLSYIVLNKNALAVDDGTTGVLIAPGNIGSAGGGAGGGIEEAPENGSTYGRKDLSWVSTINNVVDDTSPQLGGDLDQNGKKQTIADIQAGSEFIWYDVLTGLDLMKLKFNGGLIELSLNEGGGNAVLSGVTTPKSGSHAANKSYVDSNKGISDIVEDTTPQLGGILDLNGYDIYIGTGQSLLSAGPDVILATDTGSVRVVTQANTPTDIVASGINGLVYPAADGTDGQVMTTDGAGNLTFQDAGDLVADTSPQLGGDLDVNDFTITPGANHKLVLDLGDIVSETDRELLIKGSGADFLSLKWDGSNFVVNGANVAPVRFQTSYTATADNDLVNKAFFDSNAVTNPLVGNLDCNQKNLSNTGGVYFGSGTTTDPRIITNGSDLLVMPTGGNFTTSTDNGGTILKYPAADGTDGQVMTTDGAGNFTFQDAGGGAPDLTEIGGYSEAVQTIGSVIDASSANFAEVGSVLLQFSNIPLGAYTCTIVSTAGEINFSTMGIIKWQGGAEPVLTADTDLLFLTTYDQGTTWLGTYNLGLA